jgi:hypothetical protein
MKSRKLVLGLHCHCILGKRLLWNFAAKGRHVAVLQEGFVHQVNLTLGRQLERRLACGGGVTRVYVERGVLALYLCNLLLQLSGFLSFSRIICPSLACMLMHWRMAASISFYFCMWLFFMQSARNFRWSSAEMPRTSPSSMISSASGGKT